MTATPDQVGKKAQTSGLSCLIAAGRRETTAMQVTPTLIKQLRDKTGAGMMECKSVLTESEGDLGKAEELLRQRGLARAEKLSTRQAKQGLIDSYIHGGRLGALVAGDFRIQGSDHFFRGATFVAEVGSVFEEFARDSDASL